MRDLNAAIVGCRAVAPLHAQALARADGVRLAAVCDTDRSAAEELGARHGAEVIESYEDVLAREDIDLVHIVTPDELHAPMAVAAAEAGKHALVEKPMAMDLDEMDAILDAAKGNKVRIMCAQSTRFRPKFRAVKEVVDSEKIGRPVFVRIGSPSSPFWTPEMWRERNLDAVRGPEWLLMHNGMHQLDFLCLLLDSFPAEVYTVSHPGQEWLAVHEYTATSIRFENGAIALSEENRIMQPPGHPFHCDLYVIGTEGSIDAGDRQCFAMSQFGESGLSFPGAHTGEHEAMAAFTGEVQAIVDAIRESRRPDIPLEFTRRVLKSLRTACRSLHTGRNERVADYQEART